MYTCERCRDTGVVDYYGIKEICDECDGTASHHKNRKLPKVTREDLNEGYDYETRRYDP